MSMVNTLGLVMITSRTYLMLIATFVMTFSISLGQATAIQIGQLVGAKEFEETYQKGIKSLKISLLLAFIVTGSIAILGRPVMLLFTKNPDIIDASLKVFPFMVLLEVGRVFNIVVISSLHATGDIKFPMIAGILSVFLVAVPFSYFFGISFGWGLIGIWIANALDEWIRGILMYFRWKSKKWKTKSFV